MYVYVYVYVYMCIYIYNLVLVPAVKAYRGVYTHTHIYTHIYTHIHTHTHIYTHTHTHTHIYIYIYSPIRLHGWYKHKVTFSCLNRTMSQTDSAVVTAYDRPRLATTFLRTISNSVFHSFTQHDTRRQFPTNGVSF